MPHEGEKGLKSYARIKLNLNFNDKILKKQLVPVLAHKMTVSALQKSISAGDFIDDPSKHVLPEPTPEKIISSEDSTSTDMVPVDEPPSKRTRTSPRKGK